MNMREPHFIRTFIWSHVHFQAAQAHSVVFTLFIDYDKAHFWTHILDPTATRVDGWKKIMWQHFAVPTKYHPAPCIPTRRVYANSYFDHPPDAPTTASHKQWAAQVWHIKIAVCVANLVQVWITRHDAIAGLKLHETPR